MAHKNSNNFSRFMQRRIEPEEDLTNPETQQRYQDCENAYQNDNLHDTVLRKLNKKIAKKRGTHHD